MIELDLFGTWGRDVIQELSEGCGLTHEYYAPLQFDLEGDPIRLEQVDQIPEEYQGKQFAGRISFEETCIPEVKETFHYLDYDSRGIVPEGYVIVTGYFPQTLKIRQFAEIDIDGIPF